MRARRSGAQGRGAVPRPRPLQARQRFDGPRRRRPRAQGRRRAPAASGARARHRRAPGRRRVHRACSRTSHARRQRNAWRERPARGLRDAAELGRRAAKSSSRPRSASACIPTTAQVPTDLLKYADTAMYQAKEHGRNTYLVYTEAMDAIARERAQHASAALRRALERGEFALRLPAQAGARDRPHHRRRGAAALAQRRARRDAARRVHPAGRGNRPDRATSANACCTEACAAAQRVAATQGSPTSHGGQLSVLQLLRGELTRRLCEILAEHDLDAAAARAGADREHGDGERRAGRAHPRRAAVRSA